VTATTKTLARITGLLAGILACAALVVSGRVPAHEGSPAAHLVVRSSSTGVLAVGPSGRFTASHELRPSAAGDGARSTLAVRSRSSVPVSVRLRAIPASADLDRLVLTELGIGDKRVFRGELGRLRRWTRDSFRLRPGQTKRLHVRTWVPFGAHGYEFRAAKATLEWQVRVA
jgi:hypothetical protein